MSSTLQELKDTSMIQYIKRKKAVDLYYFCQQEYNLVRELIELNILEIITIEGKKYVKITNATNNLGR